MSNIKYTPNNNSYPKQYPGKGKAEGEYSIVKHHEKNSVIFIIIPKLISNITWKAPNKKQWNCNPFTIMFNESEWNGIDFQNNIHLPKLKIFLDYICFQSKADPETPFPISPPA
jgi:hypothetical protein